MFGRGSGGEVQSQIPLPFTARGVPLPQFPHLTPGVEVPTSLPDSAEPLAPRELKGISPAPTALSGGTLSVSSKY